MKLSARDGNGSVALDGKLESYFSLTFVRNSWAGEQ